MLQKQKETILALLKSYGANKNYKRNYWFSYKDYLDPTDKFTDFSCENLDGKQTTTSIDGTHKKGLFSVKGKIDTFFYTRTTSGIL